MDEVLHRFNPWWTEDFQFPGIPRERYLSVLSGLERTRDVVLVTGLRRVGKTTLLYQRISRMLMNTEKEKLFYVSLDNIALKEHTITDIVERYRRIQGLRHDEFVYLFLDEVHLKRDFEVQLKNLYDDGHAKIIASGSSSLDIVMRSSHLTGRQRMVRMFPLTFGEYLEFTDQQVSPRDAHLYVKLAEDYLHTGGIPEYVKTRDQNYLQALVETILYRDIAGRHPIRNREYLADILAFVAQGVGSMVSIRKISRVLGIPLETVRKTVDLFKEANLVLAVEKNGKLSERKASPNKIYLADTGLFQVLTEEVNLGAKVENLVCLTLNKDGPLRYVHFNGHEVDFVRNGQAWESKYRSVINIEDMEAVRRLSSYKSRMLVTKDASGTKDGVNLVPLWRFLMENEDGGLKKAPGTPPSTNSKGGRSSRRRNP